MAQTYTIQEEKNFNQIQTFEVVTPTFLETSEVNLVISRFSLTFAIFSLFANELCQCLMWFIG